MLSQREGGAFQRGGDGDARCGCSNMGRTSRPVLDAVRRKDERGTCSGWRCCEHKIFIPLWVFGLKQHEKFSAREQFGNIVMRRGRPFLVSREQHRFWCHMTISLFMEGDLPFRLSTLSQSAS